MPCPERFPIYLPHTNEGILLATTTGKWDGYIDGYFDGYFDGYNDGTLVSYGSGVILTWEQAFPDSFAFTVAYNIYYSTLRADVFKEGVKFVITDPTLLTTTVTDLTPGDMYFFGVRATEYDATIMNLNLLPDAGSSKFYPEGMLLTALTTTSTEIEITDIDQFPNYGVVQVGAELIRYTNVDLVNGLLLGLTRGYYDTSIRIHDLDGYDGLSVKDPLVHYWKGFEEPNEQVSLATAKFVYPNYAFTALDGYKEDVDILTTPLASSDAVQEGFPAFSFSGYHRDHPADILSGKCLNSYIGVMNACADGYNGIGAVTKGLSIQDINNQREEVLLETTGEPVILIRRIMTGIRCNCFLPETEYPEERCLVCFGSGFVTGWEQYVNSRRADGRILVRFDVTKDDLIVLDAGLESTFSANAWTLPVPTIKDRDFIIRFVGNENFTVTGTQSTMEEFRYEVISVTRNKLFNNFQGRQQLELQRVRKTDPIAQWLPQKAIGTTPMTISTTIGSTLGILPHIHQIVVPTDTVVALSAINGTTTYAAGHNHQVRNGVVLAGDDTDNLGHTHSLIFP